MKKLKNAFETINIFFEDLREKLSEEFGQKVWLDGDYYFQNDKLEQRFITDDEEFTFYVSYNNGIKKIDYDVFNIFDIGSKQFDKLVEVIKRYNKND